MVYKSIMLIDDDEDDQEIFLAALEKVDKSIKCIISENGKEGLDLLRGKGSNPDLIFLDLNMPVMNGQQFLIEIKKDENLKTIPVIILSTSSHKSTIELTYQLGAANFITKPDVFDDVVNMLKSILIR